MKWRGRLIWMNVGALAVVSAYVCYVLLENFNRAPRQTVYLELVEPIVPSIRFNMFPRTFPPGVEKRLYDEEKLRRREPDDIIYAGRIAHDCGAPEQQMFFPVDGQSNVFLPIETLNTVVLDCLFSRARREMIEIGFADDVGGTTPDRDELEQLK